MVRKLKKMETLELRSLLKGKKRKIKPTGELLLSFQEFKKICQKNEVVANDFDFFCAGYFLANPVFREQFLAEKKMELKFEKMMNCGFGRRKSKEVSALAIKKPDNFD